MQIESPERCFHVGAVSFHYGVVYMTGVPGSNAKIRIFGARECLARVAHYKSDRRRTSWDTTILAIEV